MPSDRLLAAGCWLRVFTRRLRRRTLSSFPLSPGLPAAFSALSIYDQMCDISHLRDGCRFHRWLRCPRVESRSRQTDFTRCVNTRVMLGDNEASRAFKVAATYFFCATNHTEVLSSCTWVLTLYGIVLGSWYCRAEFVLRVYLVQQMVGNTNQKAVA